MLPQDFLKITYYQFFHPMILHPLKIVAFGDLHLGDNVSLSMTKALFCQIKKEQPDYICLLGDNFDSPNKIKQVEKQKQFIDFILSLANLAPVMIILGSHDFVGTYASLDYWNEFWQTISQIKGVFLLNNQVYFDHQILFMGYFETYDYFFPKHQKREDTECLYQDLKKRRYLYDSLPSALPKFALFHSPEFGKDDRIITLLQNYDYILSAHYHNGCIPAFLDDIYHGPRGIISTKREICPKNARGLSLLSEKTKLIINGGIIKLSDCSPTYLHILNSLCYPELDVISLTTDSKQVDSIVRKKIF